MARRSIEPFSFLLFFALMALRLSWSTSFGFSIQPTQTRRAGPHIYNTNTHIYQSNDNDGEDTNEGQPLRFLGKGDRALIREGVVLVAPTHEYNHFLMRSAVFIHAIGLNEFDEHVTRGVIIDHPTAFTMGEMGGGNVYGTLAHKPLYQGGDQGNDSAMLLHSHGNSGVGSGEMIGTSCIYEGGVYDAMDLVDDGKVDSENFKFFFNHIEFSDTELEGMLAATDSDGDAWASLEVPPSIVLNNDFGRGDCWSYLRNQIRQMIK